MQFQKSIATLEDKTAALEERKEAERNLASQIDRALRIVEDDGDVGCNFCFPFRRLRGLRSSIGNLRTAAVGAGESAADATKAVAGSTATHRALFGSKKKKADPNAKLAEAASAMQERIRGLEYRALEGKREAALLMKQGQKAAALRALKKAKGLEKQVEQNQAALDAVEQQVDLMAQAEMQRQVTAALSTSSQNMKQNKDMLKKAETAIDDATEARDMADDLNGVMTEFATTGGGDIDEDDLLAELQELAASTEEPAPAKIGASSSQEPQHSAVKRIEEQQAAWDEAERVRRSFPTVRGTGKNGKQKAVEEKVGLISSAM